MTSRHGSAQDRTAAHEARLDGAHTRDDLRRAARRCTCRSLDIALSPTCRDALARGVFADMARRV